MKKRRKGRMLPKRNTTKICCRQCFSELEYGGTYQDGEVCMNMIDVAVCPDCKLVHQVMWVEGKPKIYTSTTPFWLYAAGQVMTVEGV